MVFADLALSRRLERAEACANRAFVEAGGGESIEVEGAYANFDKPGSPITQTFGLGMFEPLTPAGLDGIEAFFRERAAHTDHEISPLADKSVWPLIAERHYAPIEFTSILCLDLKNQALPAGNTLAVRIAQPAEAAVWTDAACRAWGFEGSLFDTVFRARGVIPFVAELDGKAIATAALNIHNGVALLAGGATIPEARRQGAQQALLATRLRYAREIGCDLAAMGAEPGSSSQRNAQRSGFQIAYTRTKWRLARTPV